MEKIKSIWLDVLYFLGISIEKESRVSQFHKTKMGHPYKYFDISSKKERARIQREAEKMRGIIKTLG